MFTSESKFSQAAVPSVTRVIGVKGVDVGVTVGVLVGVLVGVTVGVFVGVLVGVLVGVVVGVDVAVFVAVGAAHNPWMSTRTSSIHQPFGAALAIELSFASRKRISK